MTFDDYDRIIGDKAIALVLRDFPQLVESREVVPGYVDDIVTPFAECLLEGVSIAERLWDGVAVACDQRDLEQLAWFNSRIDDFEPMFCEYLIKLAKRLREVIIQRTALAKVLYDA